MQRLFSDPAVRDSGACHPTGSPGSPKGACASGRRTGSGRGRPSNKAPGCWIGRIGLDELEDWPEADKIEVGFELHQAWWGRGLANEGALAALTFGFEQHGLDRIISVTAASHIAARRVMEKAGLTYHGTRFWMNPGIPVVWYAIERAAWQPARR